MLPLGYSKHKPLVEETGSFQQVQLDTDSQGMRQTPTQFESYTVKQK